MKYNLVHRPSSNMYEANNMPLICVGFVREFLGIVDSPIQWKIPVNIEAEVSATDPKKKGFKKIKRLPHPTWIGEYNVWISGRMFENGYTTWFSDELRIAWNQITEKDYLWLKITPVEEF